jgi:hypothetical protein
LVMLGLITLVPIFCFGINSIYLIVLFFDSNSRKDVFIWPNWFCLFSLEFMIIDLWFISLQFFYIPL